jgi:hypothetical protein
MPDDPQVTTPPTEPQTQPGPSRTPDGTIIDQSTIPPTTPPATTPSDTSTKTEPSPGPDTKSPFNKDAAPAGAPEKYADFTVPDGFKLDEAIGGEASKLFKEMNLSQPQAQSLVDFYVKQTQAAFQAPFDAFVNMVSEWKGEVAKTYGRDIEEGGKHFVAVGKLLTQLGPAERAFRTAMDETGVGSHPAFVAAFIRFAEMLGEGGHVAGNAPSPLGQVRPGGDARPSLAQAMYPNLPSAG